MLDRPGKPADAPWVIPYLTVPDPGAAMAFYEEAFGFERRLALGGQDGVIEHGEMTCGGGGRIMIGPEASGHSARAPMTTGVPAPIALYIYTDSVTALYRRATARGADVIEAPQVRFWGDRVAIVADPWGYKWTFAQNVADYDPNTFAR